MEDRFRERAFVVWIEDHPLAKFQKVTYNVDPESAHPVGTDMLLSANAGLTIEIEDTTLEFNIFIQGSLSS